MFRFIAPLLAAACAFAQVPAPKITGPIPETAKSHIFGEAKTNLRPFDLAKHGYVEEEFLLSGTASVYDWEADGSVTEKSSGNAYTTRLVVRRPRDSKRFSGNVIVEAPNTARRYDWPMMWGYLHDGLVERGDAWVEIGMPASADAMKKFDPDRYGSLSFTAPKLCNDDKTDDLRFDLFAQVAAAVRETGTGAPLAGLNVRRVFLTTQDTGMVAYVNALHDRLRLEGGKPAYDGYLLKVLNAPAALNACSKAPAEGDPRRKLKAVDVPTIAVLAQGEVEALAWSRVPDSDAKVGKHRRYEIAVAAHIDKHAYDGMPSFEEQKAAGAAQGTPDWPFNARCEPEIALQEEPLLGDALNMAVWHLEEWVAKGIAPPRASRMALDKNGKLIVNKFGIGTGGVRSPYSDVPAARYTTTSDGGGNCREFGSTHPLSWAELEKLYGTHATYVAKVKSAIDRMRRGGWITPADGVRLRRELAR